MSEEKVARTDNSRTIHLSPPGDDRGKVLPFAAPRHIQRIRQASGPPRPPHSPSAA